MSLLVHRLASRWVAGETLESALRATESANRGGIKPLLNYIGEHHKNRILVERAVGIYLETLEAIRDEGLKAAISLKLSQIGLDIGKGYCLKNLLELVHRANELNVMIWIDMEAAHHISDAIQVYLEITGHYKNCGLTLQANMKRTRHDLMTILGKKGKVRLVKGAYKGDIRDPDQIEHNFSSLMRLLFSRGDKFAIATNDEGLIDEAKFLNERYEKHFEFQFLRGVRRKIKKQLARNGFAVGDYTPFGTDVLPYVWRRFKENKGIVFELFR